MSGARLVRTCSALKVCECAGQLSVVGPDSFGMPSECDDHCLLSFSENGRTRLLRPGLQILDRRTLAPLRDGLGIDAQFLARLRERSAPLGIMLRITLAMIGHLLFLRIVLDICPVLALAPHGLPNSLSIRASSSARSRAFTARRARLCSLFLNTLSLVAVLIPQIGAFR
ncbi:hypothetical protein SULPSESMR1_03356 [Pseudosulfitobacter pseudonitzschiae]|uniref:Uncharacterized protein n=1 Tax=Pseudosulfitobacter pseudonitzschiae TaxID=1402135 RepID=A0A221K544_9RHOB|nr:hypothetical protein SULPSESMR1_03356 [Pseudosulfitobacter pseudonitzschiae]